MKRHSVITVGLAALLLAPELASAQAASGQNPARRHPDAGAKR
jgi:hypothetical protein